MYLKNIIDTICADRNSMPLKSFRIEKQKALRLADCQNVPSIMVIAGPNGVGKSTLLYSIKRKQGGTVNMTGTVLYIPPHRALRKQTITQRHLYGAPQSYLEALSGDSISSFEGFRLLDGARTPDSSDESMSLMKYTLSQIETSRSVAVMTGIDKNNLIYPSGQVPDVYKPLKDLTSILLPHLQFSRIDVTDRNNVRCLWNRASGIDLSHGTATEIDLDELSSGEKSIIALFLPFIERQMKIVLKKIEGDVQAETLTDLVVLMDEPELHLHPALQAKMLDYLRQMVRNGGIQFILTTHSPTLLNTATDDELYLFTPIPDWPDPTNQLIRLTDSIERLEAMRLLCGETYPLTACRAIICLEGELPEDRSSKPSDKRILEILCPELVSTIALPMGGRNNVVDGARRLREIIPPDIPGLSVFALVDQDQYNMEHPTHDWIFTLPVCMLENLLIVPSSIDKLLEPHRDKIMLKNTAEIEAALKKITEELQNDEIRLRVQKKIKPIREFIGGTNVEDIKKRHTEVLEYVQKSLPPDDVLKEITTTAETEVNDILTRNKELKLFRGKEILRKFFDVYLKPTGLTYLAFCIDLAKQISADPDANKDLRIMIAHILAYIPKELLNELELLKKSIIALKASLPEEKILPLEEQINSVISRCKEGIKERNELVCPKVDRVQLRNDIMNMTRLIESSNINTDPIPTHMIKIRLLAQKMNNSINV